MMNGWGEESQGDPSQLTPEMVKNLLEEFHGGTPLEFGGLGGEDTLLVQKGQYPPLNLTFTVTHELLKSIEPAFQEDGQRPPYSTEITKTITTHETPTKTEKLKALNFQISKIIIGEWTHTSVYADDLKAKIYFAKKRLMWEILDKDSRMKRKIESHWSDVLSFKATIDPQVETGTLEVELGKCPKFFKEINSQPGKHTQWTQLEQDFTLGQSASKYRRHTLRISRGDLKMNLEKLVSADSFWSKLAKVKFPTLPQSLYFDNGNSNNNDNSNLSTYGQCGSLGINGNGALCHHYPQGLDHVSVENVNFNVATEFCANNQMNPFFQDNHQNETMSQLPGMQVTHPSSQQISMERNISGSHFNNPMIQDQGHWSNTGELRRSQVSAQETQLNSVIFPHPNDFTSNMENRASWSGGIGTSAEVPAITSSSPGHSGFNIVSIWLSGFLRRIVGSLNKTRTSELSKKRKKNMEPYLQDILAQEEAIKNMKCIRQFQTNGECYCNQCFDNINGSVPPDS